MNEAGLQTIPPAQLNTVQVLTPDDIETLRTTICKGVSDSEMKLFAEVCKRTGLDPFMRQIYWLPGIGPYTSIDGFRVISQRSGEYQGMTQEQWCGQDGVWREVWLDPKEPPSAVRVGVYRKGFREPIYGIATWQGYSKKGGQWSYNGPNQLAKCAEALARRKAFPFELSGLYTQDELDAEAGEPVTYGRGEIKITEGSGKPRHTPFTAKQQAQMDADRAELERRAAAGQDPMTAVMDTMVSSGMRELGLTARPVGEVLAGQFVPPPSITVSALDSNGLPAVGADFTDGDFKGKVEGYGYNPAEYERLLAAGAQVKSPPALELAEGIESAQVLGGNPYVVKAAQQGVKFVLAAADGEIEAFYPSLAKAVQRSGMDKPWEYRGAITFHRVKEKAAGKWDIEHLGFPELSSGN